MYRVKLSPAEGGCWYCGFGDGEMLFSCEFDCCLHKECLLNALETDPSDREAQIMAKELL